MEAIVTSNSFDSLLVYYSEILATGDRGPEVWLLGLIEPISTMGQVGHDHRCVRAVCDPPDPRRPTCQVAHVGTGDPEGLSNSGAGNLMLVLTKAGGHMG